MSHRTRALAALTATALPAAVLALGASTPATAWEGRTAPHGGGVLSTGSHVGGAAVVPAAPAGAHAVAVSSSALFSVVAWSDGSVSTFGDDSSESSEPCPPDPAPSDPPCIDLGGPMFGGVPIAPTGQKYVGAATGTDHGLLLTDAGRLVGFGDPGYDAEVPPALPAGTTWTGVAAGDRWSVGLRSDGRAIGWGYSSHDRRAVPQLSNGLTYTDVAAGDSHGVGLLSDGSLRTWGNYADQRTQIANQPGAGKRYVLVAASGKHSAAVRSDGVVLGAGGDLQGQVATVPFGRTAVDLALGDDHGLVLLDDGTVIGFGDDDQGQASAPDIDGSRRITALAAGADHSLFLVSQSPVLETTPAVSVPYGSPTAFDVRVGTGQHTATGNLSTLLRGQPYAATALVDGTARVQVAAGLPVGTTFLYHRYAGDARTAPVTVANTHHTAVTVTRAVPTLGSARVGKAPRPSQRGRLSVRVRAGVLPVGGKVVVRKGTRVLGTATASTARDGRVVITLPRLTKGKHRLTVAYAGSPEASPAAKAVTFTVLKAKKRGSRGGR
jgi:alpha-tubulin suppressor-like RCC1 family protein